MALDSWLKKGGGGVIERRALNKGGSYKNPLSCTDLAVLET